LTESNTKKPWEDSGLPFKQKPEFITDKAFIAKLDKMDLYVCPSETEETYDQEMIQNNTLKKSADAVGQDSAIYVAVWPEDPNKDSATSEERVHGRIISGRHRHRADRNWKKKYIWITGGFNQYLYFRMAFDCKKKDNQAEKKAVLTMQGNHLLKQGCPIEKIAATLCRLHPEMHKPQILNWLPEEWKDPTKATNRLGKTKPKNEKKMDEKCLEELENLKAEIKRKAEEIKDLENENQRLKMHNDDLFKQLWNFYNPGLKTQNDR